MTKKTSDKNKSDTSIVKIIKPDLSLIKSHGYFVGHDCHLPTERISPYKISSRGVRLKLFNLIAIHAGDIRARNMHRSYAALCAEKFRHHQHYPCTIHPYSKLRFYIELTFVILLIAASIIMAFHYSAKDPEGNIFIFHFALKYALAMFGKESASAQYYMMKKQLETYMVQRNFPPRIKSKILKFYAIRFQSKYFEESRMLDCVSGQLREDILMHTGRQLVRELDFLKQLPSSLLVQIAVKLRFVIYIAGDIIFKINTVGDCLYFIDKGTVAIYSDSAKEICHLEDGDYFGEIALVMKHHFRTASVVAVTNCELFRLDREHFETTIAHYPTVYNSIKEVAMGRFERTRVLDEHYKAELRLAGLKDKL
ncbi:hypothetical protein PYW07_004711 [Mythimna separata]|uniref:Cyclic nucleotide-binding domain-containing protein n=1 Tax=Mythimna separata TaxID=271217 RepID=A0AAD8DZ81_MYTSE|nr:hypothetical protein PYW07_004711 [Mythimna separata]